MDSFFLDFSQRFRNPGSNQTVNVGTREVRKEFIQLLEDYNGKTKRDGEANPLADR